MLTALPRELTSFLDQHGRDPLVWDITPSLFDAGTWRTAAPLPRWAMATEQPLSWALWAAGLRTPTMTVSDNAAFLSVAANNQWVLQPITSLRREATGVQDVEVSLRPTARALRHRFSHARLVLHTLIEHLDGDDIGLSLRRVYRNLLYAARSELVAELLLTNPALRVLVCSNQSVPLIRPFLRTAVARGMPTLFVPHAPQPDNEIVRDLPVSHAAMRGRGDVEWFAAQGAPTGRMETVGNPAIDVEASPGPDPTLPVVLATSGKVERSATAALFDLVRQATREPVLVAPHPSNGRRELREIRRLLSPGWRIWKEGTLELLRRGPICLLQESSGVAWEALYLGVPAIQLNTTGQPPNYPLIRAPYVPTVSTPAQLATAIADAGAVWRDPARRTSLRNWARHWCVATGREATERAAAIIKRLAGGDVPADPIWDRWGPPRHVSLT